MVSMNKRILAAKMYAEVAIGAVSLPCAGFQNSYIGVEWKKVTLDTVNKPLGQILSKKNTPTRS